MYNPDYIIWISALVYRNSGIKIVDVNSFKSKILMIIYFGYDHQHTRHLKNVDTFYNFQKNVYFLHKFQNLLLKFSGIIKD